MTNKQWYALKVQPGIEAQVGKMILTLKTPGVQEAIIPVEKTQKVTRSGHKQVFARVLFPGYVFLHANLQHESGGINPEAWERIHSVSGVRGFIGVITKDGTVVGIEPVGPGEMQAIQDYMATNAEAPKTPLDKFALGDPVKIISGPFMGLNGFIEALKPEKGLASVAVKVFDREVPIEVESDKLEKES